MTEVRKDILWRVYIIFFMMCVFGIAIAVQIWKIQYQQGEYWRNQADSLTTAYKKIEATRGNIYALNDNLIATSVPVFELRIDFMADGFAERNFLQKADSLSQSLAKIFGDRTADDYKRILKSGRRKHDRYFLLKRNVTYTQLKRIQTFPIFNLGRYKGGLIVEQRSKRELPFKSLAARTIGFNRDNVSRVGIEGAYENYLKGVSGIRLMQKISGGVWKPINDENEIEPKDGNDIVTTIDINLQDVAQASLLEKLQAHKAEAGCVILMEVATGEIRAIVNLKKGEDGYYREEYNSAIGQSTEPGSTFKLMSLMAAIEDGCADLDDSVDTQGGKIYWTSGIPMKDSHQGGYGKISVKHAFEISSNVGISKVVYRCFSKEPQRFVNQLRKMHVGEQLGLEVAGEGIPVIKGTENKSWSKTTLPYMSIGYECKLTPLQILNFYNTIANNGVMVKPGFVREIIEKGKSIKKFSPHVIDSSICSAGTIRKAKEMLEGVVQNGTAANLKHIQYGIAGKTGTARVANNSSGYKDIKYQASFVGYFPAEKPLYSCMVVVYAPSNDIYYASQVAAPVFKDIADKVYATNLELHEPLENANAHTPENLPLPKNGYIAEAGKVYDAIGITGKINTRNYSWGVVKASSNNIQVEKLKQNKNMVPDVRGMGLRDAVYLLENAGLQVTVSGAGKVIRQSMLPGAFIEKGKQIIIELS